MLQLRLVCCHLLHELHGHFPATLIYIHVSNKGGKAVVHPQGVGRGCKGLKPQQHTLSPLDR
jgi:hypothetical protein